MDDYEEEYAAQDRINRQRQRELMRHPDPRDPNYPGDDEEQDDD
jgi:hypothetical protein